MASRSDIEAGKAHILLYMKNTVQQGLNALKGQLQGVGTEVMRVGGILTGIGASIVAPLAAAVAHFADMGSELADLSGRTGETVGSLAELKFAAEQTGAGLEDIEKAIMNQQKKGISGTFDQIAARIAAIEDPAARTRAAIEAWGKSGTKLLPMVENLAALRQEARDLGLVPTEEAVGMADAIGDAFDQIKAVLSATVFEVGAALAPMLLPALETVKHIAGWFNRWARENGALIRTIALIGAGVLAAGAAATVIGAAIFGLGALAGVAASALGVLGTIVGALTSPVGLVVAAIVAGVFAWARFTESGRAAVASILGFFGPLVETIRTAVGGIGDALMVGNLELAGQIAVKALQVVFQQGLTMIAESIGGVLGGALGRIGTQLIAGDFAGAWDTAISGIAAAWDSLMAGILGTMDAVVKQIKVLWDTAIAGIRGSLMALRSIAGFLPQDSTLRNVLERGLGALDAGVAVGGGAVSTGLGVTSAVTGIASAGANVKAAKSAEEFGTKIDTGATDAQHRAEELASELAVLRAAAAQAKEAAFAEKSPIKGPDAAEVNAGTAATFSAVGLMALGQGGQTRMERLAEAQVNEAKAIKAASEATAKAVADLALKFSFH
jgi:hypothetical protein